MTLLWSGMNVVTWHVCGSELGVCKMDLWTIKCVGMENINVMSYNGWNNHYACVLYERICLAWNTLLLLNRIGLKFSILIQFNRHMLTPRLCTMCPQKMWSNISIVWFVSAFAFLQCNVRSPDTFQITEVVPQPAKTLIYWFVCYFISRNWNFCFNSVSVMFI